MDDIFRLPAGSPFDGDDDFCLFGKLVPKVAGETWFGIECLKDDTKCTVYELQVTSDSRRHLTKLSHNAFAHGVGR